MRQSGFRVNLAAETFETKMVVGVVNLHHEVVKTPMMQHLLYPFENKRLIGM